MKPSKDFKYAIIVFIACMVLMLFSMVSCNPYGFDIWTEDNPKPDPIETDTIPQDTIPTVDTLSTDTCTSYQELVNTKFSTWAANLDGLTPGGYEFVYRPQNTDISIDIDSFFNQFGQSKTYFSGINVFGIITGYDNPSWVVQHSLYLKDQFGGYFWIYLTPYNFSTHGALTFEQFFDEVVKHSNLHRIDFWNTAYTCDEYNQVIDYFIDNCIEGQGNIIDLRHIHAPCGIDQGRIDRLHDAHFTVLQ